MNFHLKVYREVGEQEVTLHVEVDARRGRPGCISGPNEACYTPEDDEVELLSVNLEEPGGVLKDIGVDALTPDELDKVQVEARERLLEERHFAEDDDDVDED